MERDNKLTISAEVVGADFVETEPLTTWRTLSGHAPTTPMSPHATHRPSPTANTHALASSERRNRGENR